MTRQKSGLGLALLVALLFCVASNSRGQRAQANYDDLAKFVAGQQLSPGSPLNRILRNPSVTKHASAAFALNQEWKDRRLSIIRDWVRKEVHPHLQRPKIVKYPFGGPDFVHAATFFPGVNEYALVGLEPLGSIPDFLAMSETELDAYLSHLTHTLRSISKRSFFITTEMRGDFGREGGVDGVFPVLLYFCALTDHQVLGGSYVKLAQNGRVVECKKAEANGIWLQIRATNRMAGFPERQDLYYFKTDLSNSGFKPKSSFYNFLNKRPGGVCYLKAASYLMHQDGFTNIRNFLVGNCQYILQDESGIPVNFLSQYYNLAYYGNYVGPIDMFKEYEQADLHQIYRSGGAKPLPFGVGYRMKDADAILLFGVRK